MTLLEVQESVCRIKYIFPVWALENDLELTRKFLQRSHLVLSHLKQPRADALVVSVELFLHFGGARISFKFLDLRKEGKIELDGKSCLSSGDVSKR